eukprot:TRINITY_DN32186_c0_g1_i1.p1 TRINITY_DN32186_c0_g1~~TRINITY_DN32186_c0_g1_i1.p1  ORF type:complete len:374 (+),score=63.68 TRINITY_DN32186_c0_g1_i1:48-1169(+)
MSRKSSLTVSDLLHIGEGSLGERPIAAPKVVAPWSMHHRGVHKVLQPVPRARSWDASRDVVRSGQLVNVAATHTHEALRRRMCSMPVPMKARAGGSQFRCRSADALPAGGHQLTVASLEKLEKSFDYHQASSSRHLQQGRPPALAEHTVALEAPTLYSPAMSAKRPLQWHECPLEPPPDSPIQQLRWYPAGPTRHSDFERLVAESMTGLETVPAIAAPAVKPAWVNARRSLPGRTLMQRPEMPTGWVPAALNSHGSSPMGTPTKGKYAVDQPPSAASTAVGTPVSASYSPSCLGRRDMRAGSSQASEATSGELDGTQHFQDGNTPSGSQGRPSFGKPLPDMEALRRASVGRELARLFQASVQEWEVQAPTYLA